MKISMDTYQLREMFGDEQAIRLIKEAGFDCVDYSYYWMSEEGRATVLGEDSAEYAKKIRALLDELGIKCNQAHAPFVLTCADTFDLSNRNYLELVRSLESAAILGAENTIVHAVVPPEGVTEEDYNYEFYKSLEPYCEKYGIHIAVENLFKRPYNEETKQYVGRFNSPEKMYSLLKRLDSEWFVVCIDVGHATITGIEPEDFIAGLDNKVLKALHIQDNDYERDRHLIPYTGLLHWDKITESLGKIGYDGEVSLEIFKHLKGYEKELVPEVLHLAASVARNLVKKIENSRG